MTYKNLNDKIKLYTIGHSNRSFEELLSLLKEHGIQALADIRRFPSSRKFPHFNQGNLQRELKPYGIEYHWFEDLGGRRESYQTREESPNTALQVEGFRHYADYMQTEAFENAVDTLLTIAGEKPLAYMCAEKMFFSCHRRLLSDYLAAQGP